MEEDHGFWGRPEDMGDVGLRRPAFVVNATHPGSDLAAQAAAALAAVSTVGIGVSAGRCISRAAACSRVLAALAAAVATRYPAMCMTTSKH